MVTIDAIRQQRCGSARARNGTLGSERGTGATVRAAFRRIAVLAERRRSRRALLEMTDDQLCDIGVNRAAARREALRPFWD